MDKTGKIDLVHRELRQRQLTRQHRTQGRREAKDRRTRGDRGGSDVAARDLLTQVRALADDAERQGATRLAARLRGVVDAFRWRRPEPVGAKGR